MDKLEKFDYMGEIEDKLGNLEVYELFDDLLKQLLVQRPDQPLDFLLDKLKMKNPGKQKLLFDLLLNRCFFVFIVSRVFFMGAPGCKRNEFAGSIADYFQWEFIQTGEALR